MKDVVMIPIGDVIPYEKNPRKNKDAVDKVAASLREFGFRQPIVVDKDRVVVAGHTRLLAAKKLKMKEVPVLIADDLDDEQIKAYRLADNKTAEFAEWDTDLLLSELDDILDIDMEQFGFDLNFDDEEDEDGEDGEPDEMPEDVLYRVKRGDIWQLGTHRLICGDCTDVAVIDALMDGETADMVLTDPPYGMNLDTDFTSMQSNMSNSGGNKYDRVIGDNDDFSEELINTIFANFAECPEVFLFGADYFAELLPNKNDGSWLVWDKRKESQADGVGSEFELIWSKSRHKRRMLRHDWFGFLSSEDSADARHRVHPTQKPVSLLVDILSQWGENADVIVDIFGGSGSTMIACEQTDRRCFMAELSEHYCDVIISRWEQLTGNEAVRVVEGDDYAGSES